MSTPHPNQPLGPDEVEGSRRHAFYAMYRQRPLDRLLPNWIDEADVAQSAAIETCCDLNDCPGEMCPLVDATILQDDEVLETNAEWNECTTLIGPRREIKVSIANEGLTWDTKDVAPGVYSIEGYTWEPPFNIWSKRRGFVKVVDSPDDTGLYPAAAVMDVVDSDGDDNIIDGCETVRISGCVDAGDGATLDVYWRASAADAELESHRIVADEPVQNGSFEIEWEPENLPAGTVLIRADVKNACGTYTAHAPFALDALAGEECEDGAVFMSGDDGEDVTDDKDNQDKNTCEPGAEQADPGAGCGCRSTRSSSGFALIAAWLLGLKRRRAAKLNGKSGKRPT